MRKNTYLETLTAIVFIIFVGIILYYSFYPFKVTTLNSIGIDSAEYCRGEWVQIELNFTKHMDIQAQIKWYIVDGIVYELESPGVSRPIGENFLVIAKQVPYSILPGKYNMRIEATYQVHPLHKTIINTWNTPTFTVLDAKDCDETPERNQSFPDPVNKPDDIPSQRSIDEQTSIQINNPETLYPTTVIIEHEDEPQVFTPEPEKSTIKDILERVKGLL